MSEILILGEEKKQKNLKRKKGEPKGLSDSLNSLLIGMQKLKLKDKLVFYRLLATMINAGVTIIKSIGVLEEQEKNPVLKNILGRFSEELKSGKSLSECIDLYPKSFGMSEAGMIRAGEKTGRLNGSLKDLADQLEKVNSISGKIKSAMMYPLAIIFVVIGVIMVLMTKVVPKLIDVFAGSGNLPQSTRILVFVSDFFRNNWYIIIMSVLGLIIFIQIWKRTPVGRYKLDLFMIKIPIFGGINTKMILSKFSRILSGLISSGVSIVESLSIVADAVGNDVYRQRILLLREDVKQGIKIWESLDGDKYFPAIMVQMVQVGEQTAKLDQTIIKVADFYDEQVDNTVGVINKLLEPFIIVFLAVVVGGIAVGIMQPIMQMSESITA